MVEIQLVVNIIGEVLKEIAWTSVYKGGEREDNSRFTDQFYEFVIGWPQVLRRYQSLVQYPLNHLISEFCYRVTHHLHLSLKSNGVGRMRVR